MKNNLSTSSLILFLLVLASFGCKPNSSSNSTPSTLSTDSTDSTPSTPSTLSTDSTPSTLSLNGLTWTAENLNLELPGSWCYDNTPSYCKIYGRLYNYEAANQACKSLGAGWRLPTMDDWEVLVRSLGGELGVIVETEGPSAFKKLLNDGESGLNLVRGGSRLLNEMFTDIGDQAYYWTTKASPEYENAYRVVLFQSSYEMITEVNFDVKQGASCRCVRE